MQQGLQLGSLYPFNPLQEEVEIYDDLPESYHAKLTDPLNCTPKNSWSSSGGVQAGSSSFRGGLVSVQDKEIFVIAKLVLHFGKLCAIYHQLIPPNELLWHADAAIKPMLNFGCEVVAQPSFALLRKRKFAARRQRHMVGAFEKAEITTAVHS